MGSGSSAAKRKYSETAVTPLADSEDSSASTEPHIRSCDKCGETRRTACLEDGKWFCVACQLESGAKPKQRTRPLGGAEGDAVALKPQPQLRRGATFAAQPVGGAAAQPVKLGRSMSMLVEEVTRSEPLSGNPLQRAPSTQDVADATLPAAAVPSERRRRRRAKERAVIKEDTGPLGDSNSPLPGARYSMNRSSTMGQINLQLERDNYKSVQGLRELKNGIMEERGGSRKGTLDSDDENPDRELGLGHKAASSSKKVQLPGGFHSGDRVSSLVTRYRFGLLVLEPGQEGVVVSAARGEYASTGDDGIRLLVQFQAGHDWCLPLRHICVTTSYNAQRAAPLPGGHKWGARVRSLVTYLNPPRGSKEIWLGDAGTVIGPGQTKGKIAVRFDDGRGDWSIWPSTVCDSGNYLESMKERFAGGYSRGDRVSSKGCNSGSRSAEKGAATIGKLQLSDGEEGTVVGPGHASGWVLVHFDSDEKVWSLKPSQLRASSSCI